MSKRTHAWGAMARLTWSLCLRCGLLRLRNDLSERAARASCPGKED